MLGRAKRRLLGIAAAMLALCLPAGATADILNIDVTIGIKLGLEPEVVSAATSGVATVNETAGGDHLVTLKFDPISPTNVGTVVSSDPAVTAKIKEIRFLAAEIKGGTLFDLSGAATTPSKLTQNTMPLAGLARICLVVSGCAEFFDIPFTENGTRGIGIGGNITTSTTTSSTSNLQFTLVNAPWQIATATLDQRTLNGALIMVTKKGYAIGPASLTSSTAKTSGIIQLISPTQISTQGIPGGHSDTIAMFTTLTVTFLPEPEKMLLLGSGIIGLVLIGRNRMRG